MARPSNHPAHADGTAVKLTSWLRTYTVYNVPSGGRTETFSGMGLGTCGSAMSNAAADRQPAQSQQWTADYSHRSPASYRRAESRRASAHRFRHFEHRFTW